MEPKKPKSRAPVSASGLLSTDKEINVLRDKILPYTPHSLSVPTEYPFPEPAYDHYKTSLFNEYEESKLQYMTLQSNADRGIAIAQGNWEEIIKSNSPVSAGSQTGTSTPNATRDSKTPKVKLSIADYKNFKTSGVKPSPKPSTSTTETKTGNGTVDRNSMHSRNTSAVSITTPMSRVSSTEGGELRANGIGGRAKSHKTEQFSSKEEKPTVPRSVPSSAKDTERSRTMLNGNIKGDILESKDTSHDSRLGLSDLSKRHAHVRSPQNNLPKRPSDSTEGSRPEKRAKVEHPELRTTFASRGPDVSEARPHSSKVTQPASSQAPPLPKKAVLTTRPIDTKVPKQSGSEKALDHLPTLLSPLPADLIAPSQSSVAALKKSGGDKTSSAKTPSEKSKNASGDTIVVKQPKNSRPATTSSPLSTSPKSSPPFVLPRMLSPGLPDIVEAELSRLQNKSAALNTVEARYEKARQPGAPGVPQKRPKIGHPPKKAQGESSAPSKKPTAPEKESLIVKIKYKKRLRTDIERILRLRPSPTDDFKAMERKRLEAQRARVAPVYDDSESEDDLPIAKNRAGKAPAGSVARKRVAQTREDSDDSDYGGVSLPVPPKRNTNVTVNDTSRKRPADSSARADLAPKRTKASESINSDAKASTSLAPGFRSPTTTSTSSAKEKALLSTPKRSEVAKKGVAMSKVMSNDGHARTPQTGVTSTPASSEKPRTNGFRSVDQAQAEYFHRQNTLFFPIGTRLKRQLQSTINEGVSEFDSPSYYPLLISSNN
ncbi:hypothetical protein B0O99DRAFT_310977 [Bisporella sp. PMI_857]|nr:hypothetical protein B0O99DRAFT_310977 [Bisporella sp. PMI_857]